MAKRAQKVQEQVIMADEITHEEALQNSIDQMVADTIAATSVEVDASGRKKHVTFTHEELEAKGLKNKSQLIRFLDSEGFSRSAIAGFLNVRYQHVRNVLVTPLKRAD